MIENTYKSTEYKDYKIKVYYDECPDDPRRDWDCHIDHMICWHPRYSLGDEHHYENVRDIFKEIITAHKAALLMAARNLLNGKYDGYRLESGDDNYGHYMVIEEKWEKNEWGEICNRLYNNYCNMIYIGEYIIEELNFSQLSELCKPYIEWSQISIYDHSGITVWLGGTSGHVDAQWDCSSVGISYVERDELMKNHGGVNKDNWRKIAWDVMEASMKEYDDYVRGQVYGYVIEDPDGEETGDSCWGYYGDEGIKDGIEEAKREIDYDIKHKKELHISRTNKIKEHINDLKGKIFIGFNECFQIGQDMFGQAVIQKADAKRGYVDNFYEDVNLEEIPENILETMEKAIA